VRICTSLTVLWLLLLVVVQSSDAGAGKPVTEAQAFSILQSKVRGDRLYSSWTTAACLTYVLEKTTDQSFDIAIRERHGNGCPGDPDTAPVVDRYRVHRKTKQIRWYEPVEDKWRPYKEVLKARLGKQALTKPASPEDVIKQLYEDFSRDESGSVHTQEKEVLSRYFDFSLVDLMIEDQECQKREKGVCNLDFMVLWDAQDEEISDFTVGPFDPAKKTVNVTFKNYGKPETLVYKVNKTAAGWRISDIKYKKGRSLVETLRAN